MRSFQEIAWQIGGLLANILLCQLAPITRCSPFVVVNVVLIIFVFGLWVTFRVANGYEV